MGALKAEVGKLRAEITALKEEITALKSEIAALKEEIARLKEEIAGLKAHIAALEQLVAQLQGQLAQLQGEQPPMSMAVHEHASEERKPSVRVVESSVLVELLEKLAYERKQRGRTETRLARLLEELESLMAQIHANDKEDGSTSAPPAARTQRGRSGAAVGMVASAAPNREGVRPRGGPEGVLGLKLFDAHSAQKMIDELRGEIHCCDAELVARKDENRSLRKELQRLRNWWGYSMQDAGLARLLHEVQHEMEAGLAQRKLLEKHVAWFLGTHASEQKMALTA